MHWYDETFIAFDLETTGKYPLESEICEIGAVKWRGGKVIDEFQTLIKPKKPMSETVIAIHNITNEMVESAPAIHEKISEFHDFISDGYGIAHHAPFDMGFLMVDFESAKLAVPSRASFCSSLLARKYIRESMNHRLKTLVMHLGIPQGQAHRGLDDARMCLEVALKCFERADQQAGRPLSVEDMLMNQEGGLSWKNYSMAALNEQAKFHQLLQAIREQRPVHLGYSAGSRPGQMRQVQPIGVVRNPQGDFLVAVEFGDTKPKRYLLEKITDVQ